jgi:hypothetical protein
MKGLPMKAVRLVLQWLALVASFVALVQSARTLLHLRWQLRSSPSVERIGYVGKPLSAAGIDIHGKLIVPAMPNPTDTLVAFVLRSATFDADLAYWDSVWHRTNDSRRISLLAYCGDRKCIGLAQRLSGHHFPVIGYAQILSLERLGRADMEGSALIVNHNGTIKESWSWRDATAAETSSHIMEVQ